MVEMKILKRLHFLKEMNEVVYSHFPDAITIAEESTSWTGVSQTNVSWRPGLWPEMDDGLDA